MKSHFLEKNVLMTKTALQGCVEGRSAKDWVCMKNALTQPSVKSALFASKINIVTARVVDKARLMKCSQLVNTKLRLVKDARKMTIV
jgi:hypothetical protein